MPAVRPATLSVIDSHTAGEPTRLVIEGGPSLGEGPLEERLRRFCAQHDHYRRAIVPGGAYDRSPCGTGTSAKLACLAADGKLAEGEPWVQESLIGSTFTGRYRWHERGKGEIVPTITGRAHVTAESVLRLDPDDPFCWGIAASESPAAIARRGAAPDGPSP